ncbi:MAG: hypothetical protein AB7G75_15370, partial [Candidatus Binatia bacterium]
ELLYQHGLPPQATYLFKHALIQDTAYQSLLKSKRQQLHQQIAQVLEVHFPDTKESQPELLAHYYTEASLKEQAISYWQQAGQRASQRSAYVEAIAHLTKGLELLKTLSDSPERTQQELTLQMALGAPLMATKGLAASEVGKAYARAQELCQQVGDTPQLFPVLRGLLVFLAARAEHGVARGFAQRCLRLAQSVQDPALLMEAHYTRANNLFWLGEFVSAREHFEQSMGLYDSQRLFSHPFLYGQDTQVVCLARAASVFCLLGYLDQGLKLSHKAIALARELSHPHSLAYVLSSVVICHQCRQEEQVVLKQAEEAITLSTEQGFTYWVAWGTIFRGWALARRDQGEEGIIQLRQGLVAFQNTEAGSGQPYHLALLAEAYGKAGQVEEGLIALTEALEVTRKTDEHWYEAELYRLKGELTLQSKTSLGQVKTGQDTSENTAPRPLVPDPQGEAEACFFKAIAIAQRQQAKSLELRAVMSLVRLRQQQASEAGSRNTHHVSHTRLAEAHKLLSDVYNWFTEGFDTQDLQEARSLLDELGG